MPSNPPPPPPPPTLSKTQPAAASPKPPVVAPAGSTGSFLVELLIFNGSPFKDHWAFWVRSHAKPHVGVLMHAAGDVRKGFRFEISRSHDFEATGTRPTKRIPLQWVDVKYFDEDAMFNSGKHKVDNIPVCAFEASAHKIKAPEKTLNAVDDKVNSGKKITQRNCQTWIVESADQLVKDHIFSKDVAVYVHAIKQ